MLNILSQFINNFLISTKKDVVCTVRLVGCDEIWIQRSGKRDDCLQFRLKLLDQVRLEDSWSLASIIEVHIGDVPTADLKLTWINHGNEILNWFVHIIESASGRVMLESNVNCWALGERPIEVGWLNTVLWFPGNLLLVGKNTSNKCRTIVAAEADEHDSQLGYFLSGLNNVFSDDVLIRVLILVEDRVSLTESRFNPFTVVGSDAASCLY